MIRVKDASEVSSVSFYADVAWTTASALAAVAATGQSIIAETFMCNTV